MRDVDTLELTVAYAQLLADYYHELPESSAHDAKDAVELAKKFIAAAGAALPSQVKNEPQPSL